MMNRTLVESHREGTVSSHATGIILAGTHPWTNSAFDTLPRTLLPVAHQPLISYGLSWLHAAGVSEVAVCGNRETRLLQSRLSRHVPIGLRVSYHEDPMPRGAGGSARDAATTFDTDTFVVIDGTSIPTVDLTELLTTHRSSGASVTVVVHSEARGTANGPIDVPSGIYVFERRALEQVPAQGFCDIKEKLIPQLYAAGHAIIPFVAKSATPRVLDAATYLATNAWMVEQIINGEGVRDGYRRTSQGLIHEDAVIADDASVVGPVIIGPGARVMSGAVVLGPTSIARDVTIEAGAMISRAAIWRRAVISEGAIVDGCIVTDGAVVETAARMSHGEVIADRHSELLVDWQTRESRRAVKRPAFDVGVNLLGRLVFGPSWSRSPVAQ